MSPQVVTKSEFVGEGSLDTTSYPQIHQMLKATAHGATDIGKRSSNQDQFVIAELMKMMHVTQSSFAQPAYRRAHELAYLFVVADGIGGHAGGEQASQVAIEGIEEFLLETLRWFFSLRSQEEEHVLNEFQQALGQADARLFAMSQDQPELRGMGTTLTMAFLIGNQLFLAHAGDSRCYISRDNRLYQLTKDHTLVAQLVEKGALSKKEAEHHPWSHVITNSLGGNEMGVQVDVHKLTLAAGDTLLLCSDGLSKEVNDQAIAKELCNGCDPERACTKLVSLAKEHGGKDNITAVVACLENA